MLIRYKTVLSSDEAEIIEKKSRFIAYVRPVKTEEEAQDFIQTIRKKHYNASHNVFAYQIGENNEIQRASDDGEPSGTAGKPILDILKGEDIRDCCIVVTRYFGGTLLGTGGLVRAYGKSAKEGLKQAQVIEQILYRHYSLTVDYTASGKVQYEMLQGDFKIRDTIYTDLVTFDLLVESPRQAEFEKKIEEITNGQIQPIFIDCLYESSPIITETS